MRFFLLFLRFFTFILYLFILFSLLLFFLLFVFVSLLFFLLLLLFFFLLFRSLDDLDFAEDIGARVGRAVRGGNGGDSELDAVDGLLDALSGGEYLRRSDVLEARKNFEEAEERMRRKEAEAEIVKKEAEMRKKEAEEAVRKRNLVDENDDDDDATTTTSAASSEMDRLLASAASQIESLRSLQTSRLSRPPPPHLSLVRPASAEEVFASSAFTLFLSFILC